MEMLLCRVVLGGGPGVLDGCRWVVRVIVKVFDEYSGVVTGSSSGVKDKRDQVNARILVEIFFSSRLAMKPGRALAADMSPALEEKGGDNGRINIVRAAT